MKVETFKSPYAKRWESIRNLNGGLNTFTDAQDIQDTEFADVMNVTFDKGYPTPRKGSMLKWTAPNGETNPLLNLFAARASDGTNYVIAVYAPNFYIRDEVNDQWVKINSTYTPSSTYKALPYGYTNWNAGIGADMLYAGNGTENCIKIPIGIGYVSTLAHSGATSLVLTDSTKLPATGTIVIQSAGGTPIYTTFSANSSNTLTVPSLSADVPAGSIVASQVLSITSSSTTMKPSRIFAVFQQRLIIAGGKGTECTIYASYLASPENFTTGSTFPASFFEVIPDGKGGIIGLDVMGEYLIAEKTDSIHKISIDSNTIAQSSGSTTTITVTITPTVTDVSMGPISQWAKVKKNNILYYASATEGIFSIDPTITGSQTSIAANILSLSIQPTVTSLNFADSRTTSFGQKILWTAKQNVSSDTILVYDLLRKCWSKFNSWLVKDWLTHNSLLYYGSASDGGVYQAFTDLKIDGDVGFPAYVLTKRFDMSQPVLPKTTNKIFVSGYISQNETLKFDVILTTGDKIITIPYQIKGNGKYAVISIPKALAMYMLGLFALGMPRIDVNEVTGFFKAYLAIPSRYGFYTMQLKVYSNVNGTDWGFTGIGFAPSVEQTELKAPQMMVIGSIFDTTNEQ